MCNQPLPRDDVVKNSSEGLLEASAQANTVTFEFLNDKDRGECKASRISDE